MQYDFVCPNPWQRRHWIVCLLERGFSILIFVYCRDLISKMSLLGAGSKLIKNIGSGSLELRCRTFVIFLGLCPISSFFISSMGVVNAGF